MASRWARFVRGWITALFAVFVAAVSHVLAGGETPSAFAVVVSLAFAGMAAIALAGKTLSLARLAISVAFAQTLFHTLFSLGGAGGITVSGGHHGGHVIVSGATHVMADHSGMILAHVIAGILTIFALSHGEAAFWAIVRLARRAFSAASFHAPGPVAVAEGLRVPLAEARRPRALLLLADSLSHRGPPLAA